ncbi:ABC-2 type transport system permease protein [Ruminiclostridium sufflavum DSM 19573]|uniref:ABC-2 type transport system permease protein n=1 Tax=Ruminiclostridium sufflavum DSM 19573 TaxID=1121337 RepID=A0A318YAF2_9FIRM|nr:ABC transporter permease [Ruminiclostridium sufflavum]PYG89443.1 ABC-2 type transport system permease protein [Ruminiclostridium sufflavum DSM 19573]
MLSVFKKEFRAYFTSPIAYVLIGLFMLLSSMVFYINLASPTAEYNYLNLTYMSLFLILIIPVLTMKILADERKSGTEVLLTTSPTSLTKIVIGKYLAAFAVFMVMTVITFVYPILLKIYGNPDIPEIIGGYVGYILLGASFIAFGIFASSLTESQIVAAIVGIVGLLIMWLLQGIAPNLGGIWSDILNWFSLYSRTEDLFAGILSVKAIVYYLSFSAVFVFLAIRVIEKRRWSKG